MRGFGKIGIIVILAIIAVGGYIYYSKSMNPVTSSEQNTTTQGTSTVTKAPASSGNVSDAVAAFSMEADQEAQLDSTSDSDASVVTSDKSTINSYNSAYDENSL
jgi:hypothetical protein